VRSSGGRVRASSRRCSGLAASLIALSLLACGDDITPRLAPARFVYDGGTEQIARHQLYDRTLGVLCEPTEFSDGRKYCKPPTNDASYFDASCARAVGRVAKGAMPVGYFATRYFGDAGESDDRLSRVFRAGAPAEQPAQRWEKYSFGCVASPADDADAYDYFQLGEEIEMAPVTLEPWFRRGEFVVENWHTHFLSVVAGIQNCDLLERANAEETNCIPYDTEVVSRYVDPTCQQPAVLGVPVQPWITYETDPVTECTQFYRVGTTASATQLYDRVGTLCIEQTFTSSLPIALLETTDGPTVSRTPTGTGRIQLIQLAGLPVYDDLVRDTVLGTDCQRRADGRCVPANPAHIETWFADYQCSQPIDVALVRTGGCNAPVSYAERDGVFYPIGEHPFKLYELDTGDTCSSYVPPPPFVAHSIGPALSEDAFARATLMIE
jgi:hypothetical protein